MFKNLLSDLINDLIQSDHTEGVLIFLVGAMVMLRVQIANDSEYKRGLKGSNTLFEAPEISMHLFFWYSPYVIMYGVFMQVEIHQSVWYFMAANLAFALMGRIGLERIISLRFGGGTTTTMKESKKEITTESHEKTE